MVDGVWLVTKKNNWDPTSSLNKKEELPPRFPFRIQTDLKAFFTDPISDIVLAPDQDNLLIAHAIIIGRETTPYEGGFFYFYIRLPYDYPISAPVVKLMTTGQNTVRFNPNLYEDGKVRLSILRRPQWSPGTTLYSVLLSIKSIMNEYLFDNVWGWGYGVLDAKLYPSKLKYYKDIIRHETIRVAVIGMLENSYDCRTMPDVLKDYITLARKCHIMKKRSMPTCILMDNQR